jgi:hypothetical protein
MISFKKIFLLTVISFVLLSNFAIVCFAAPPTLKNSSEFLDSSASNAGFDENKKELDPVIGKLIKIFISLIGITFFILTVAGGFMWMTSTGNADKIDKARKLIIHSAIGLVIAMFAYAIVWLVVDSLISATGYTN